MRVESTYRSELGRDRLGRSSRRHPDSERRDAPRRHCQTNLIGPVEPTIEGSQAASLRHSAKAAERLSLKFSRL